MKVWSQRLSKQCEINLPFLKFLLGNHTLWGFFTQLLTVEISKTQGWTEPRQLATCAPWEMDSTLILDDFFNRKLFLCILQSK